MYAQIQDEHKEIKNNNNDNNKEAIELLTTMGFELEEINKSLQLSNNDPQIAVNRLLTHTNKQKDKYQYSVLLLMFYLLY